MGGGYEGDKENEGAEEGEGAVEADLAMWAGGGSWAYLIFVIFFTQSNFLENKIYTENANVSG